MAVPGSPAVMLKVLVPVVVMQVLVVVSEVILIVVMETAVPRRILPCFLLRLLVDQVPKRKVESNQL